MQPQTNKDLATTCDGGELSLPEVQDGDQQEILQIVARPRFE
jgi:hypothetical protein